MTEIEKLQKAVQISVTAGYQLDKEAFEFLSTVASAEDPTEIMVKAIKRMQELKEKPLFINRQFLTELIKEPETSKEIVTPQPPEPLQAQSEQKTTEGKRSHIPFAKEVESNIKVIEDPTTKLSSNGTIENYCEYFRDRFHRISKLLRQRMDVKSAASIIDAFRAPPNTRLKVICIITEKREAKQKILLTVEDFNANVTVLIPQNASEELTKKARLLLLDQVVCISVLKTRSNLLIAEDIIFPDIPQKPQNKASEPVYVVLTSDMHVGSTKFQKEAFSRFILWLNGRYGDQRLREIASHVKYVLIAGDIVDGIGVYPNQIKELAVRDVYGQYRLAAKYLEQIPDYIEVIVIPGNHDTPRNALPQPAISNAYLETLQESRKVYSLGNPSSISLHNVEVLMYHGRSLDDILSTVSGINHEHPEKAMRLMLQSRHLAPTYGGKTPLSPEDRDFLVIERVPDIFHAGHVHVVGYCNYRGVLTVNSGGWQEQTDYMKRLGLMPTPAKVPVVNLQTMETMVIPFS